MEFLTDLLVETAVNVGSAFRNLIIPALIFLVIAIIFKPKSWKTDIKRALPETGVNLQLKVFNLVISMPIITIFVTALAGLIYDFQVFLLSPTKWEQVPTILLMFVAIFVGDFVAYWRHRLEHTPLLWPAHAVHHSDTEMTWLTNARFHPINVATTVLIGITSLLVLGLPVDIILSAALLRHYYGDFIHADLPWTYGSWGKIFVSPAMHRWHHSAEEVAHDKNFAGVFSIFDRMFGTFYVPGAHDGRLGVTDSIDPTFKAQMSFAFEKRAYKRFMRSLKREKPATPAE